MQFLARKNKLELFTYGKKCKTYGLFFQAYNLFSLKDWKLLLQVKSIETVTSRVRNEYCQIPKGYTQAHILNLGWCWYT